MQRSEAEAAASVVQVAVRVRPLSASEIAQACDACVRVEAQSVLLAEKQYTFDAAFAPETPQERVYGDLVAPLIDQFFDGYNATVFAYGQTGSGKTYTMGNEFKQSVEPAESGIIPRGMAEVFRRIESASKNKKYQVNVSYLEILNEDIHDLLAAATANSDTTSVSSSLSVRGDGERGISVAGLTELQVGSVHEVGELLRSGAVGRATASTDMNAQSSRSHAICTLTMQQTQANETESGATETRLSKFHLVDLAGSERVSRTNTQGDRFKEGVSINRGLLSLGNVINALCDRSRTGSSTAHIPYRDSKLTRLLQDSLGGNSKTLMIACISPADVNFEETANTLRYASRARSIENKAVMNKEVNAESEVARLKQQLAILQLQLLQQSGGTSRESSTESSLSNGGKATPETGDLAHENQRLKAELHRALQAKDKWKKVADRLGAKDEDVSVAKDAGVGVSSSVSEYLGKAPAQGALASEQSLSGDVPLTPIGSKLHGKEVGEYKAKTMKLSRQEQLKKFQLQKLVSMQDKQSSGPKRRAEDAASASKRRRTLEKQPGSGPGPRKPGSDGTRISLISPASARRPSVGAAASETQTIEEFSKLLQQTFDTQATISGAKNVIRLDLEERKRLAMEVSRIETSQSPAPSERLAKLRSELKDKSGHIRLLQQKLASVERNSSLPPGLFPTKTSLCHQVIRLLLETSMESKGKCSALSSACAHQSAAEQVIASERDQHKEAAQALSLELDAAKKELQTLREQMAAMPPKRTIKKRKPRESYEPIDVIFSSSEDERDDSEDDSDYVEDERPRKARGCRRKKGSNTPAAKASRPTPGNGSDVMDEIDELLDANSDSACCGCHGKCATKACACKAQKRSCGADCLCKPAKCLNSEEGRLSVLNADTVGQRQSDVPIKMCNPPIVSASARGVVVVNDVNKPRDNLSGATESGTSVANRGVDHRLVCESLPKEGH